jgi:uncharacterized membrane protein (DUF485 family)
MKNETIEALKSKLNRTKLIMQIATLCIFIMFIYLVYSWFSEELDLESDFSLAIVGLSLIVIFSDKKYKKIKAELKERNS